MSYTKSAPDVGEFFIGVENGQKIGLAYKIQLKVLPNAGLTKTDHDLEAIIIRLLQQRRTGASICPSEAEKTFVAKNVTIMASVDTRITLAFKVSKSTRSELDCHLVQNKG